MDSIDMGLDPIVQNWIQKIMREPETPTHPHFYATIAQKNHVADVYI